MTGDNASRRAEDIGGQELSYAEVKAIASGNPAVLTLAEADAELQRLAILRKNHLDEQFIARRQVRDLPAVIHNLRGRLATLAADQQTAEDSQHLPMFIGHRAILRADVPVMLEKKLDAMPIKVIDTVRFPMGSYRGLNFGLILHPRSAADIYLEGEMTRITGSSSANPGPRAILNGLERLLGSYATEITRIEQDASIAESQLHDYESRLGQTFAYENYLSELTQLRNALKDGLSGKPDPTKPDEGPTVSERVTRIKCLKADNTIDTSQTRTEHRHTTSEEPVTARILRKQETAANSAATEAPSESLSADDPDSENLSYADRIRLDRHAEQRNLEVMS
jgi:hypothetical protein